MEMIKDFQKIAFGTARRKDGLKQARSLIVGEWMDGKTKESFEIKNPANGEGLYFVNDINDAQAKNVFTAARIAQDYWYQEVQFGEKEKVFRKFAEYLESYRGTLADIQIKEGGRLLKFADAEVGGALNSVWHYYGEISRMSGDCGRSQMKDKLSMTIREPYGVILGITPWNSSLVLPSRKAMAAMAGGNAIIIKDSSATAVALNFFVYLFHQALKDIFGDRYSKIAGIFQLIHGRGKSVGKMLVERGDYDKVMFTGSSVVGAEISAIAGGRIKPSSLELEGRAAVILMDDFDIDRAVEESIAAAYGDAGQRCVALRTVFVHDKVSRDFINRLIIRARAMKIGDPSLMENEIGPIINRESLKSIHDAVIEARKAGAKIEYGGNIVDKYYFEPTILSNVSLRNSIMSREIFGPVLSVISFSGENREEAILNAVRMVNGSNHGLSNAIMTTDINLAMKAMERVKTGVLYIGRGTTGAEEGKPFGGVKGSGFGREAGGLDEVTYLKQVYVDYHGKPRMANMADSEAAFKRVSKAEKLIS